MKYLWAVDQARIVAEFTGIGRVTVWVDARQVLRTYALDWMGARDFPFLLPNGQTATLTQKRVLVINGAEVEPLDPLCGKCRLCESPMTPSEAQCPECGLTQTSLAELRKQKVRLKRVRRPLTVLTLLYLAGATYHFARLCVGESEPDVAIADMNADYRAEWLLFCLFMAAVLGVLALTTRRFPVISLLSGAALLISFTFDHMTTAGHLSRNGLGWTWFLLFLFVPAFADLHRFRRDRLPIAA